MTSRISGDKVTASLANLNIGYDDGEKPADGEYPIDICLAKVLHGTKIVICSYTMSVTLQRKMEMWMGLRHTRAR